MPRSQVKHPALAQQALQADIVRQDEDDLNAIVGWERFSPLKKQILTVMPWFADGLSAYRYIKDDPEASTNTFDSIKTKDPDFRRAIDHRKGTPVRMVQQLGADMLGRAMLRLNYYIDAQDVPARDQLKAIEMIMNMNHIDSGNAGDKNGIINYGKVNMFNIPATESKPEPIDNIVVTIQDSDVA